MHPEAINLKKILPIEHDLPDVELSLAALGGHHPANRVRVADNGPEALASSRKTSEVIEFYQPGSNANIVEPVDFAEFVKAVREGVIWAAVHEPSPRIRRKETSIPSGEVISSGKKKGKNEIATQHPAPGG